jgi:hypothetical protein
MPYNNMIPTVFELLVLSEILSEKKNKKKQKIIIQISAISAKIIAILAKKKWEYNTFYTPA